MRGDSANGALRVLFAGGGSGGHLMPGVATAETMRRLAPGCECLFLIAEGEVERQCLGALRGFRVLTLPATPWHGAGDKALFPLRSLCAAQRAWDVLRRTRPHVVVGLGGCHCVAPVLMGRALGARTALFESNAVPGLAVNVLSPLVDRVFLQWGRAALHLRTRRTAVLGNPVRSSLFGPRKAEARRRLGLSPDKLTVLVMGGSQGALPLNRALHGAVPLIFVRVRDVQVLHLTGVSHLPTALEWQDSLPVTSYRPIGFLERMADAYAAADIVVARTGASTLAELTAVGLPSVLVPHPGADGHQDANAAVMAEAGAAIVIPQSELTARRLADAVIGLAGNEPLRAGMAQSARRMGKPRAALHTAAAIAVLAGFGPAVTVEPSAVPAGLGPAVRAELSREDIVTERTSEAA